MLMSLITLISYLSKAFTLLIIGRVILSWVNPNPNNFLVSLIYRLTEPVLRPVRSILPSMGGLDFSPILVLVGIQVAEGLLIRALLSMAM